MTKSGHPQFGRRPRRWWADIQMEADTLCEVGAVVWDCLHRAGIGVSEPPQIRVDDASWTSVRNSDEVRSIVANDRLSLSAKGWLLLSEGASSVGRMRVHLSFMASPAVARDCVLGLAVSGFTMDFATLSPEPLTSVRASQLGLSPPWLGTVFRPAYLALPRLRHPLSPGEHPRGPAWLGWSNVLSHDCFVESGAHDAWRAGRLPGEVRSVGGHHEWLVTREPLDVGKVADIQALRRAYLCLPWLVADADGD